MDQKSLDLAYTLVLSIPVDKSLQAMRAAHDQFVLANSIYRHGEHELAAYFDRSLRTICRGFCSCTAFKFNVEQDGQTPCVDISYRGGGNTWVLNTMKRALGIKVDSFRGPYREHPLDCSGAYNNKLITTHVVGHDSVARLVALADFSEKQGHLSDNPYTWRNMAKLLALRDGKLPRLADQETQVMDHPYDLGAAEMVNVGVVDVCGQAFNLLAAIRDVTNFCGQNVSPRMMQHLFDRYPDCIGVGEDELYRLIRSGKYKGELFVPTFQMMQMIAASPWAIYHDSLRDPEYATCSEVSMPNNFFHPNDFVTTWSHNGEKRLVFRTADIAHRLVQLAPAH